MNVKIGEYTIGRDRPVFLIGEIGINHNGDISIARELIDVAAQSGLNAVKFQKRDPDVCVPESQRDLIRETPWGLMSYIDYRKRLEFDFDQYSLLQEYATAKGLEFFASPWDVPSAQFLRDLDVPAMKIASASVTDVELLEFVNRMGLPVILSTGMSSIPEIENAISILDSDTLMLAHSTSTYPCPPEELNLRMIMTLQRDYGRLVGYSGHEIGIPTTVAAVALGAVFVERHITLSRTLWGSDQSASVEAHGLEKMVRDIRTLELALGDGIKQVYESELGPKTRLRRVN